MSHLKLLINMIESKVPESIFLRLLFFLITFAIAMLSAAGPAFFIIPFFPAGLFTIFIQNTRFSFWSIIAGWLVYLFLIVVAISIENRRLFLLIYTVFVILLVINIAGCRQILPTLSFD